MNKFTLYGQTQGYNLKVCGYACGDACCRDDAAVSNKPKQVSGPLTPATKKSRCYRGFPLLSESLQTSYIIDCPEIMAQEDDCVSRFFQEQKAVLQSPDRVLASSSDIDSSQDLSQTSVDSDMDALSLSQLTIEEYCPIKITPFYNITPRCMPVSPHYVVEEEFSSNPWAMLIATIFLTKTSNKTARPYMREFFEAYPTPYHVLSDNPTALERFFENLGLRKRGRMIWKLSYQFVSSKWRRASDLCGIGKYGEDAYRIFCLGHTDLDPSDRYLKLYLDWLRSHTDFLEDNGVMDSVCIIEDPVIKYYRITLRDGFS